MKKILFGVSGIGNGHANRQISIIEELAKNNQIMIFAHDDSYRFFSTRIKNFKNITLVKVAISFVAGNKEGLDFAKSANLEINQKNFLKINYEALAKAQKLFKKADLVISDYEPISAQFAYATETPLVTIDQQSKFLYGDLPTEFGGFTFNDEISRLRMFFPKAAARVACSFFTVKSKKNADKVLLFPSPLKETILNLKRQPKTNKSCSVLVYISSAREFTQTVPELIEVLTKEKDTNFHLFIAKSEFHKYKQIKVSNISLYPHFDPHFNKVLSECNGIISTAGHSLLSEAMYLNIPVYAIPISPYEQHLNAKVIGDNNFGVYAKRLTTKALKTFIDDLDLYAMNIKQDKRVLIKGNGKEMIIQFLHNNFLNK